MRKFVEFCCSNPPNMNRVVALSTLLMLRPNALAGVSSERLEKLANELADMVDGQSRIRSFKMKFRAAALCIAYLVRRREFDPGFLGPDSSSYSRVRGSIVNAHQEMQRAHVMGGRINLLELVQQIIDYLDARGHGRLVALALQDTKTEKE